MSQQAIYDIEGATERAASSVLRNQFNLNCYSSQDAPEFKKGRPYIIAQAQQGPGMSRFVPVYSNIQPIPLATLQAVLTVAQLASWPYMLGITPTQFTALANFISNAGNPPSALYFYRRESAWSYNILFSVITDDDINVHTNYRTQARAALSALWTLINNYVDPNGVSVMPFHCLELQRDAVAGAIQISPEKGFMKTDQRFEGLVSIQANAWAQLLTP